MDRDQVEEKLRRGGTVPLLREPMGNYDLYISEGHSSPPHLASQKLGIQPEDFPFGMHVTFYWLGKDEKLLFGSPSFYCALNTRQETRVADVRRRAKMDLDRFLKAQKDRGIGN